MRLAISASVIPDRQTGSDVQPGASPWTNLFRIAGAAALIAALLVPVQIVVFVVWPPPFDGTARDWFDLFQDNALLGLLSLDLLLLVDWILLIPIYLALFVALRRTDLLSVTIGTALFCTALAAYLSSNTAFEMMALSDEYAAATTDAERATYLAAGEAMLATFEGTAFHVSYVLGQVAGIIIGVVMLRSRRFGRWPAYLMIIGNAVGLGLYLPVVGVTLSALSGVILWAWFALLSRRFLQLGRIGGKSQ